MSAPLELKGHLPLSLENQFANSIRIDAKIYHKPIDPLCRPTKTLSAEAKAGLRNA
jgi:hypothetical protein